MSCPCLHIYQIYHFLFMRHKSTLNGQMFSTIEQIRTESLKKLKAVPKTTRDECFKDRKKRWQKFLTSNNYFEANNINV